MSDAHAGLPGGYFTIHAQERILFGKPAAESVVAEAKRYGASRVFVTSTRSLAKLENGPLQRIERALGSAHVGTHTDISAHSPREDVVAAANKARAAKADLLVAVGGGSVIDATKAMLLCLWLGLDTTEAMEPYRAGLDGSKSAPVKVPAEPIRMIAVSTTLSASEFTPAAGVTDTRTSSKQSFGHRLFAPRSVILDPEATLDTPDWLLFCTGIRSVDHAVESYCSTLANPATEALSLQGLKLLYRALPAIKANPKDLKPRLEAQFGMWQAIAASTAGAGSGASHGIGYALGSTFGVAHGHTSCVMLPAVLRWNAKVNGERQRALSEAMGAPDRPAGDLIAELVAKLDQPGNLRAVGIKRENLDELARRSLGYKPVKVNPRPIKTVDDVREILELAW
ncbi:MAG TPA: iron-containing alcohol dehydrogenase [Hyphomicrobiaceae bacterium]|nr:iron-containing alcohol dehydrogenase [Hyphomicrobiaceae bacterium]